MLGGACYVCWVGSLSMFDMASYVCWAGPVINVGRVPLQVMGGARIGMWYLGNSLSFMFIV